MKSINDILPIKTATELINATKQRLRESQFRITNLREGGVMHTIIEAAHQGTSDLYQLLRKVARGAYLRTAEEEWADLKAAEYETYRLDALRTRGNIIFGRNNTGSNVPIPAGTIVATKIDRNGDRLQYSVIENVVLPDDQNDMLVPVEATEAGSKHNVDSDMITELVTNVPGIDYITNVSSWITREGTDIESTPSLINRARNKWDTISIGPGEGAYISAAQEVPGVYVIDVIEHPRGEGTIDVVIAGPTGIPSLELLDEVQEKLNKRRALCADVQAFPPEPVEVDFDIQLIVHPDFGDLDDIEQQAREMIDQLFVYNANSANELNGFLGITKFGLFRDAITANLMRIEHVLKAPLNSPSTDIQFTGRQLAVKGTVNITVERLS